MAPSGPEPTAPSGPLPGTSPVSTGILAEVVLDCPVPRDLAEFYRALLGWSYAPGHDNEDPEGDEWLVLVPPVEGGTKLAFQRSAAAVPPWRAGAIVHLDIRVDDLDVAARAVQELGARPLTRGQIEDYWVFADPAGHPFCLVVDQ